MQSIHRWLSLGLGIVVLIGGCKQEEEIALAPKPKPYDNPLPPGEKALVKLTDPAQFPDFSMGFVRRTGLEQAALYSLDYLQKPSSQQYFPYLGISHQRTVVSLETFIEVMRSAESGPDLDARIKDRFDIYISRGYDELGTVLFTGYYRPIFDARLEPDAEFRFPLLKRPADLTLDEATHTYGRPDGSAYYTRAEIHRGSLGDQGLELCYLRDRFEAYIVTVQGSARLRLKDGSFFDIGYHGDNGHEYSSIGQWLVDHEKISPNELSLQGLIRFFHEHPEDLDGALAVNARTVFFTPRTGGPYGALNVPVTPFRTIATDNDVYPRACVAFLQTKVPGRNADGGIREYAYEGFALDQDTGGAIRAAGRCDFFLGTGPEVGELAGRTFSEGKLFYIFVKPDAERSAAVASALPSAEPVEPAPEP